MKTTICVSFAVAIVLPLINGCAQPQPPPVTPIPAPAQGVASVPAPAAAATDVSPGVSEVIRLAQSGVSEEVVLAYVQNSTASLNLTADQILYLRDLGISSPVITAMLNRDTALKNQPQPEAASAPQAPPPTAPVEAPLTPAGPVEVATPPVQVNYFYGNLAPYGTWVDLEGFGWCWQPSVVVINRGWRPYCDGGHWVYTDCGWFWQSDYSWGWAAFHYGRWHLHPRCGWVWLPDTVWGPSWVVWRTSGDYCGWAPLPPRAVFEVGVGWRYNGVGVGVSFDFGLHAEHFTFVGMRDFNERELRSRRLEPTHVTRIYNNTTIINNYTVNNTTIVNRGISVERVASAARSPVHRATVRDVPAGPGGAVVSRQTTEKTEAVVYRPKLVAPEKKAPVTVQKVDARHPVIQHRPAVPVATTERGSASPPPAVSNLANRELAAASPAGRPAPRSTEANPRKPEPAPRKDQPARNKQTAAPSPSAPTATQPSQDYKQPGRSTPPYRTESAPPAYPVQSPGQGRSVEARGDRPGHSQSEAAEARGGNPHVYYPKSYPPTTESREGQSGRGHQSAPAQSGNPQSQGQQQKKGS